MEKEEKAEFVYEMKKRPDEIEKHFQWRKTTYMNAMEAGVEKKLAYLYANICANVVLLGVEYDSALMEEAMKYCPPDFKQAVEQLQAVHTKSQKGESKHTAHNRGQKGK